MAGIAKPNDNMLEVSYVVNSFYSTDNGSSDNGDSCGLFNGVVVDEWSTNNVFYFRQSNNYIDITINNDCNIYRCGTASWSEGYQTKLKIEKYENEEWIDITGSITQNEKAITHLEWDKWITNLQRGRYKFSYLNGVRLDSEWFIEKEPKVVLKQNGKVYSILKENYNIETGMYNEITTYDIENQANIFNLINEITIGNETFRPIDKFEKFSIVSNETFNASIIGIKQNTSMVVASDAFGVRNASNIDYFNGYCTLSIDSCIKMAVSVDEGETWKTATVLGGVTTWSDLNITIPKNMYSSLTSAEKQQWDNAKDIIYNNGIDISILKTIDFNQIKDKNMMFAYVLYMPALDSVCKNQSLEWKFDSRGRMKKMKDNEYDLYLTYDNIVVTPLSVQSMIKINVVG